MSETPDLPPDQLEWDSDEVAHAAAAYQAGLDAGLNAGYQMGLNMGRQGAVSPGI